MIIPGFPMPMAMVGGGLNVADVFSTDLYVGTGSTPQTIDVGIDTSEGMLTWIKQRDGTNNNVLWDTLRGDTFTLITNSTGAEIATGTIFSFTPSGFHLGVGWGNTNLIANDYAAWSFRRAPKFFDIVTYTGNGVAGRQISHNLGTTPGMIVVKRRDSSTSGWWATQHISTGSDNLFLESPNASNDSANWWNHTPATDTEFSLGININVSGASYVAYIFAHDPSPTGIIQCGSYVGTSTNPGPMIDLGWEPQWLLIKRVQGTGDWAITDIYRDLTNPRGAVLRPNKTDAEVNVDTQFGRDHLVSGFQIRAVSLDTNVGGETYIYMAIRAEAA